MGAAVQDRVDPCPDWDGVRLICTVYCHLRSAQSARQTDHQKTNSWYGRCRTTATPVSQWTVAEDPDADQPTIAVSKWVAQEAALQSQAAAAVAAQEEEALPPLPVEAPPRRPSTAPVSKWTLVDYDEDNPPTDLEG